MLPAKTIGTTAPVFLVRHGETESNLMKRYAGRGDEVLTRRGRLQAERIARELLKHAPSLILSSRIARARETADRIAKRCGAAVQPDARLDELLMGPWEGLTESEVASRYPREWELWCRRPHELSLPGRETLVDIQRRVMSIVEEASFGGPRVLVTHVAAIRVATLSVLGLPLGYYKRVDVPNACCIRLELITGAATRYPNGACLRNELLGRDETLAIA